MVESSGILETEKDDLKQVLVDEPKNYHAWQYRQWLVKRFDCWDDELGFVVEMLMEDPYNNSAWNHRYFVLSCHPLAGAVDWDQEIQYAICSAKSNANLTDSSGKC